MNCETYAGAGEVTWCKPHRQPHANCLHAEIIRLKAQLEAAGTGLVMLQVELPWGANDYNKTFQESPALHKDFQHALVHILKALGKLSSFSEAADHAEDANFPYDEISKYLADVVICTVRMANVKPHARVDLSKAVLDRIEEKMGVRLLVKSTE